MKGPSVIGALITNTAAIKRPPDQYKGRRHTVLSAVITNALVERLGMWRGEADRMAFDIEDEFEAERARQLPEHL